MNSHPYRFIPYGRQHLEEDDIQAVVDVLRSDWITQGPKIAEFENQFADFVDAEYAVACTSGTTALHLACNVLGISQDDIAITAPISFVASMNCAVYCGAIPAFVDIDPRTICLDSYKLERYIKTHGSPKVVVPVHFAGNPCDMERISMLAKKYGFSVIEDACHALGAVYVDSRGVAIPIGSAHHSDMCVFSFHPVKHITTGEGGMITTNNKDLYEKLLLYRSHGITKDKTEFIGNCFSPNERGDWFYEQQYLGWNYRITDFQCALGIVQLQKLPLLLTRRRNLAQLYKSMLDSLDEISVLEYDALSNPSWHIFPIQLENAMWRRPVFDYLRKEGIGVNVHYIPIHLQPYYQIKFNFNKGDFPCSEDYYQRTLTLPLFPDMTDNDVQYVVTHLKHALICAQKEMP